MMLLRIAWRNLGRHSRRTFLTAAAAGFAVAGRAVVLARGPADTEPEGVVRDSTGRVAFRPAPRRRMGRLRGRRAHPHIGERLGQRTAGPSEGRRPNGAHPATCAWKPISMEPGA